MNIWKELTICTCGIMLMCAVFNTAVMAGGPALKNNACGTCHKDFSTILPKTHPEVDKGAACLTCHASDPAKNEPTTFSTGIHKAHQGEKTKLECTACHVL